MHTLTGFWHAAATLSGRIDLSGAETPLSDRTLAQAGVHPDHRRRLRTWGPTQSNQPFVRLPDVDFPDRLRPLPFAPPVLFYMGNLALLQEPCVALVGARKCTGRGKLMAQTLAHELTRTRAVTVSGIAYGIDHAVHFAAPSRTIAVLGQGIESALNGPKRGPIESIVAAGGLILSEFLPRHPPSKWTFPLRNRVVSGISIGTIVIEAGLRSGSLITARHALDQGRELLVIPGHPMDRHSEGCNSLLIDGATPVRNANDVRMALGIPDQIIQKPVSHCEEQQRVVEALGTGTTVGHVVALTGLPVPVVNAHLSALELTGWLVRLSGGQWSLRSCP